eukprot:COSAG01_NODE_2406_length_7755_cov_316.703892_5_plen_222_part_00
MDDVVVPFQLGRLGHEVTVAVATVRNTLRELVPGVLDRQAGVSPHSAASLRTHDKLVLLRLPVEACWGLRLRHQRLLEDIGELRRLHNPRPGVFRVADVQVVEVAVSLQDQLGFVRSHTASSDIGDFTAFLDPDNARQVLHHSRAFLAQRDGGVRGAVPHGTVDGAILPLAIDHSLQQVSSDLPSPPAGLGRLTIVARHRFVSDEAGVGGGLGGSSPEWLN